MYLLSVYNIPVNNLEDFGASVIRVDKPNQPPLDTLARYIIILSVDNIDLYRIMKFHIGYPTSRGNW